MQERTRPQLDVNADRRVARENVRAAASLDQPTHPRRRAAVVRRLLAGGAAALALVCGLTVAAPAPTAAAFAVPLTPAVVVVPATSPLVTVAVPVATTTGADATVWAPTRTGLRPIGVVAALGAGRIRVTTADLLPGSQTWWLQDGGDGTTVPLPVQVVRPSRVDAPTLTSTGTGGLVVGAVHVTHRDLATGRPAPSQQSPVRLERYTRAGWTAVATWTTGRDGIAYGSLRLPPGIYLIHAVRPGGDTVTAATSPLVRLGVFPGWTAGSVATL